MPQVGGRTSDKFFLVGRMVGRRTAEKKRRKNFVLGSPFFFCYFRQINEIVSSLFEMISVQIQEGSCNPADLTITYKSPKLELWLELDLFHLYSCNDLTTSCFKLTSQKRALTIFSRPVLGSPWAFTGDEEYLRYKQCKYCV